MNKLIKILIILIFINNTVFAKTDKYSYEHLQNKSTFTPMATIAEALVEHGIKSALKKETGARFNVKFNSYSLASMKKGIFKSLELSGKNVEQNGVKIHYVHLKSLTDYNYIDYKKNPIEFKSDMKFAYELEFDEDAINQAITNSNYKKTIDRVNRYLYPLFIIREVKTKIINNKLYLLTDYNSIISNASKNRTFVVSSDLLVNNGEIKFYNTIIDSGFIQLSSSKISRLVNYLNPLEFTLSLLDSKQCQGNVENVKIIDNKVKIDGTISIKGD